MIPSKVARLKELQEIPWRVRTDAQSDELDALRTDLAREQQEKADDPNTWLVNESSRPNLDGSNYNDTLHAMCCDELKALALKYGPLVLKTAAAVVLK